LRQCPRSLIPSRLAAECWDRSESVMARVMVARISLLISWARWSMVFKSVPLSGGQDDEDDRSVEERGLGEEPVLAAGDERDAEHGHARGGGCDDGQCDDDLLGHDSLPRIRSAA